MTLNKTLLSAASLPESWKDFLPGSWMASEDTILDQRTKKVYKNTEQFLSKKELILLPRVECAALALMYPIYGIVGAVMHVFARVINIFKHGFIPEVALQGHKYVLIGRDLAKILLTPLALLAMQISLLYGIVKPRDGKKMYASLERVFFGGYVYAYYQSLYEKCPPLQPISFKS
jgi:hypothetical protein